MQNNNNLPILNPIVETIDEFEIFEIHSPIIQNDNKPRIELNDKIDVFEIFELNSPKPKTKKQVSNNPFQEFLEVPENNTGNHIESDKVEDKEIKEDIAESKNDKKRERRKKKDKKEKKKSLKIEKIHTRNIIKRESKIDYHTQSRFIKDYFEMGFPENYGEYERILYNNGFEIPPNIWQIFYFDMY